MNEQKIPFWRDARSLNLLLQVVVAAVLVAIAMFLLGNLVQNFQRLGLTFGFNFLQSASTFEIGEKPIFYQPGLSSFGMGVLVGLVNSLRVMLVSLVLATLVGVTVGIARLSENWLVRQLAMIYVEIFRNTPLLLQLFFWYSVIFLQFPDVQNRMELLGAIFLVKSGVYLPFPAGTMQTGLAIAFLVLSAILAIVLWRRRIQAIMLRGDAGQILLRVLIGMAIAAVLVIVFGLDWQVPQVVNGNAIEGGLRLSPEFGGITLGLVLYTAAFIAEAVRAGIQSVPKGQWEAARSLGLHPGLVMQLVVFPQALRVMIPPLTSEYLNLAKNSSLASAIGYPDVYFVANTIANQTGKVIEMFLTIMISYLTINLMISFGMNRFNRSVQLKER